MEYEVMLKLDNIIQMLKEQTLLKKEVLNHKEAAQYLSLSPSNVYKHTMNNTIPFYKLNGKLLYFKRTELDAWIFSNRKATIDEVTDKAKKFQLKNGRVK